jgi:PKD repeat protein
MPGAAGPCDWGGDYPYAGLTYEVMDAETLPVTVQFNSTSRSPPSQDFTSWHWDFGDGTTSMVWWNHRSIEKIHPQHTYSTYQDHFDVCLEVTTQCDKSNEACERVQAYCTKPKARFTINVSEGPAPLAVRITDTSEHTPGSVTTWVYKKDGGTISTGRDFAGTFTEPGVYTITQTVKKNCNPASDSFSRQLRVTGPTHGVVSEVGGPVTTVPTLAVVGVYFNFSNATSPSGTISPTTRATPFALQTFSLVPTSRGAAASPASVTTEPSPGIPAAAGTAAIPGTGTLAVTTNPAGAQVIIDGVLRGASPATVPGLAAGPHMLRLEREGYQVMTVPFTIDDGRTTDYATALVPDSSGSSPVSLPFIAGAVLVLVFSGAGAYLYAKRKKAP